MNTKTTVSIGSWGRCKLEMSNTDKGGVDLFAHFTHNEAEVSARPNGNAYVVRCFAHNEGDTTSSALILSRDQVIQLREALNRIEVPA